MSGPVDLGQTYRYRQTVRDASGVLANAGTVTVTITLPDGTTSAPSVVNPSTGVYDVSYTTAQSGLHHVFGSATGGVLSAEFDKWEDSFTVETPRRVFIGLDETSAHLRASGVITSDADREQLRTFCLAACDAVERVLVRTIARRTVTEVHYSGGSKLVLRKSPIISITSVADSGVTLSALDYTLEDESAAILRRGGVSGYWYPFTGPVSVTYVAGYLELPPTVRMVAKSVVQSMWQQSQQASHPLIDEAAEDAVFAAVGSMSTYLQEAFFSLRAPAIA